MIRNGNMLLQYREDKSYHYVSYFLATSSIVNLILNFFILVFCSGCFFIGGDRYEDITAKPPENWSSTDNLTVLISPVTHNLFDQNSPNVKVIVTPYYPSMIVAISRDQQRIKHLPEEQFRANTDTLMADDLGMYMDWKNNKIIDSHGNYLKNPQQFDSLMFLITISNHGWHGNIPVQSIPNGRGSYSDIYIIRFSDMPIYIPEIVDLEQRIILVNDNNETLQPRYVWGRKHNILTMDETLFAMFILRHGSYHFLNHSENMYMVVKGFENEVKLRFPVSMMH